MHNTHNNTASNHSIDFLNDGYNGNGTYFSILNIQRRLARQKARLVFLLKCRRWNLTPKFIQHKTSKLKIKTSCKKSINLVKGLINDAHISLLNAEIADCQYTLNKLNIEYKEKVGDYARMIPEDDFERDEQQSNGVFSNTLKEHNKLLHEKFEKLKSVQHSTENVRFDETMVKNVSGCEIPQEMMALLALGPKFALPIESTPMCDLITDLEVIINRIEEEKTKKEMRAHVAYMLTEHSKKRQCTSRIDKYLIKATKITSKFLKEHPDIFISNSDKGSITVIAKRSEYTDKMEQLIADENCFENILSDPTGALERKNNRLINTLHNKTHQYISIDEKKRLRTYTSIPPRIFGQLKCHKEGRPIRPIVSTINSPSYKLARFLATIIKKSFTPKYSIKNTKQFLQRMRKRNVPHGYKLISFDVVNCFNNISTELALELIQRDFDSHIKQHTDIPKNIFMNLLRFCLIDCNYFCYNNQFFKMKSGLFMGSSLAPICVERVLEHLIDETLLKVDAIVPFWESYVDDHITALPEDKIKVVLDALNSYHPNISFTYEIEDANRQLNYLDVTLIRNSDGKVISNWYHKPMATNRILNFYSNHPTHMKLNTAKNFINRVLMLSHKTFFNDNLTRIRKILQKNNYPNNVINGLIARVINKSKALGSSKRSYRFLSTIQETTTNITNKTTQPQTTHFNSLVFVPGLTDKLAKISKNYVQETQIAMRPAKKLSLLFSNMKHKLELEQKSGIVYKIGCNDCNSVYIGESKQLFGKRLYQHQNDCKKKKVTKSTTALAKHSIEQKHSFNFDNAEILKMERTKQKLQIQEVNQIIKHEDIVCNYKTDKKEFSAAYYNLIKSCK